MSAPVDVLEGHGNAREQLAACEDWLGWQDEDLSEGLRRAEDALKLYRYWLAHPELPEMADEEVDGVNVAKHRRAALGYDPLKGGAA
jgi:hypothetical protein